VEGWWALRDRIEFWLRCRCNERGTQLLLFAAAVWLLLGSIVVCAVCYARHGEVLELWHVCQARSNPSNPFANSSPTTPLLVLLHHPTCCVASHNPAPGVCSPLSPIMHCLGHGGGAAAGSTLQQRRRRCRCRRRRSSSSSRYTPYPCCCCRSCGAQCGTSVTCCRAVLWGHLQQGVAAVLPALPAGSRWWGQLGSAEGAGGAGAGGGAANAARWVGVLGRSDWQYAAGGCLQQPTQGAQGMFSCSASHPMDLFGPAVYKVCFSWSSG
jgi:hypothetical protein